jgi:hypothetical protein
MIIDFNAYTMKYVAPVLLLLLSFHAGAQKRKVIFPIWTFQQMNTTICGVSVGLWSFSDTTRNTHTNGIRLSLIGEGIIVPFVPRSPLAENDSQLLAMKKGIPTEAINGINISGTGSGGAYIINGISVGMVGHLTQQVNGISASAINFAQIHNGIQVAIYNECYKMHGIQIGFENHSKDTRGIQFGFWNVNERRKLPLINWNFRRKKQETEG